MNVRTVPFEPSFCQAYTQLTDQPTTRLMGSHSTRGTWKTPETESCGQAW